MTHSAPASMLDPHHVAVAAEGGGRRGRARAAARLHRLHRTLAARRGKSRRRSRRRKEKKLGVDQGFCKNIDIARSGNIIIHVDTNLFQASMAINIHASSIYKGYIQKLGDSESKETKRNGER